MKVHLGLCSSLMLAAVSILLQPMPASGLGIEKVLPFAGADRVRIEVTVSGDAGEALQGVELAAHIELWPGGDALWSGTLGAADLRTGQQAVVVREVSGLRPKLWSPTAPNLYNLTVLARRRGARLAEKAVRFGFRSFVARHGQFFLNDTPIFLRGNAINPPGRGVPEAVGHSREFTEAYLRDLKSRNINLVRVDGGPWLDVCDELGMMVFCGRYGAPRGGTRTTPPPDFDASIAAYKSEYFERYQRHPSVVISILSNEMPYRGQEGEAYLAYLDRAYEALRRWDANRLYIGSAGFGRGRGGDIYDTHPYWGWYGGSFLDYYRLRKDPDRPPEAPVQPWTFSECVGCYTTSEGALSIAGKLLGAALAWTGHAEDQSASALSYQAFLTGQAIESVRRLRPINPRLAGIMPFTYIFFRWEGISSFADMRPKPVADQMRVSYQPVLLSWEMWTPHVYAGANMRAIAHVVNDADDHSDLKDAKLRYALTDPDGKSVVVAEAALPDLPYYQAHSLPVRLSLPASLPTADYTLTGEIVRAGVTVSRNSAPLFVARSEWAAGEPQERPVALYDPSGQTAAALQRLGLRSIAIQDLDKLSAHRTLVIGEEAWDAHTAAKATALREFIRAGGRLLLLRQGNSAFEGDWLAARLNPQQTHGLWVNPERPQHPVFAGIGRERLHYWSDNTGWDQTQDGVPRIHPVTLRFLLKDATDLGRIAVLANFGTGLARVALCEVFDGSGSAILCGFDLVRRAGLDPVADRLLANLVRYAAAVAGHEPHPLITSPIRWGDYASERGVVAGPFQGLLVNAEDASPRGRRPFGPFTYGGATGTYVVDPRPESESGSGVFAAAIPAGRTAILTQAANPTKKPTRLQVEINGAAAGEPEAIPPGQTVTVKRPLPAGATHVLVRYTGHKALVLLETAFE